MAEVEEWRSVRLASEEHREAMAERRVLMKEHRIAIEDTMMKNKQEKQEQQLMFMNPVGLDDKGREYFENVRDQVLAAKTISGFMGGFISSFGGDFGDNKFGGGAHGDGDGGVHEGGRGGGADPSFIGDDDNGDSMA